MFSRIVPVGDSALQVEFENEISLKVSTEVMSLCAQLEALRIRGISEMLPSYRALMIHYDPFVTTFSELRNVISGIGTESVGTSAQDGRTVIEIPVIYNGEDLQEVADYEGITVEEVIRRHSENPAYIYFLGFSPGLGYAGCEKMTFTVPRRKSPRQLVPYGTVGIWRNQTAVMPADQPTGWNVIGRTPFKIFDIDRDPACLIRSGWWMKFVPVESEEEAGDMPRIYHEDN